MAIVLGRAGLPKPMSKQRVRQPVAGQYRVCPLTRLPPAALRSRKTFSMRMASATTWPLAALVSLTVSTPPLTLTVPTGCQFVVPSHRAGRGQPLVDERCAGELAAVIERERRIGRIGAG